MRALLILSLAASLFGGVAQAQTPDDALIERGRYLATAGDCAACHTQPRGEGKPFAGGYGILSPLGSIFSSNITPSKTAGIGNYTEAQFARAIREGVRADGGNLYPAMPYTSYSLLTDEDVHALYTYFMKAVRPVDEKPQQTALPFPFNLRFSMKFWNALFLNGDRFKPDPSRNAEYNRGAYLVEALEHCSACHTPRNQLMAEMPSQAFAGAPLGTWYAPNITSDPVSGIGGWSEAEIVQYLRTGAVHGKAQAGGGMAEAVEHSLQHLTDADLKSIAVYLKAVPPIREPGATKAPFDHGTPVSFEGGLRGAAPSTSHGPLTTGEQLYSGACASCHQPSGGGTRDQAYPSLFHNTATGGTNTGNLISAILFGVDREAGGKHVLMPRFDQQSYVQPLDDQQVALISNYVLEKFGNAALRVTAQDVATIRAGGPASPLMLIADYAVPLMIAAAIVVVLVVAFLVFRLRRRRAA